MEAKHEYLLKFMGSKNDFIIPVYQRNYDWKKDNCERLFNDISNIINHNLEEYFMGAFTIVIGEEPNKLIVIDGQQRLTTLSLLLLAIHNLLNNSEIETKDRHLKNKIMKEYLIDDYTDDKNERIKLKQVNQDNAAYNGLFCDYDNYEKKLEDTNIYLNYIYFKKSIKNEYKNKDIKEFYEALGKIKIVEILLKTAVDKPQLVFETINATGKKLTDADLIRNFILMDKEPKQQKEIFENYWTEIERNTRFSNEEQTSKFIWHFLIFEKREYLQEKNIYKDFRNYVSDKFKDNFEKLKEFLEKLKEFSIYYKWIAHDGPILIIKDYLQILRDFNQTNCYSYLLGLVYYWKKEKKINPTTVETILKFIINYYVRRYICKERQTVYSAFFPTITKRIEEYEKKYDDRYLDAFYRVFANSYSTAMPNDKALKDNLFTSGNNFYSLKICKYVFVKLVNDDTKEKIKMDKISIEHIMPKKLTDNWMRMLKENTKESVKDIHANYLESLGNLTVTGYNTELSNKQFKEKKEQFAKSNINLNKYFKDIDTWNKEEIQKRTQHLAEKICEVFKYPTELANFVIEDENNLKDFNTLEKSIEIVETNNKKIKPIEYKLRTKRKKLQRSNWAELIEDIAKELYKEHDKNIIKEIASNSDIKFITNEYNKDYKTISNGDKIFLKTVSNNYILKNIKKLLTEYEIQDDFKLKMEYRDNEIS